MPYVTSQGLRIHYDVVGEGPPLVMHHWTMGSGRIWRIENYVEALEADYQMILIDARGHGLSDKPHEPEAYLGPRLASDVVAVIDDLSFERVHYWGYSMGARVGFVLADEALDRVASFVLGGGHPFEIDMSLNIDQDGADPETIKATFLGRFGLTPDNVPEKYREVVLGNDFLAVNASLALRPSVERALEKMTMPCLIYAGDADPFFERAKKAADRLPNAKFVALPGLGHAEAPSAAEAIMPHAIELLRSAS